MVEYFQEKTCRGKIQVNVYSILRCTNLFVFPAIYPLPHFHLVSVRTRLLSTKSMTTWVPSSLRMLAVPIGFLGCFSHHWHCPRGSAPTCIFWINSEPFRTSTVMCSSESWYSPKLLCALTLIIVFSNLQVHRNR